MSPKQQFDRILPKEDFLVMQTVPYTAARNRLAELMEQADRDRKPILITRYGAANAVLVPREEYASMEETLHLLSSAVNARRLFDALDTPQSAYLCFESLEELERTLVI